MNHTKGDWRTSSDRDQIWILDEAGNYLAEICTKDSEGMIVPVEEQVANADLMASAPKMYAALMAFREEVCKRSQYNFWKKFVDAADEALDEAKGE